MAVVGRSWLVNERVREQRQTVNLKLCGSPKENTISGALASYIVLNKENNAKAKRAEPALAKNRKRINHATGAYHDLELGISSLCSRDFFKLLGEAIALGRLFALTRLH